MKGEPRLHEAVASSDERRRTDGAEETVWERRDFLEFSLGDGVYACETNDVQAIVPFPGITRVPTAPGYILGVFHHRGAIIPALDIRGVFGLPPAPSPSRGLRCVIVHSRKYTAAFVPDVVIGVSSFPVKAIEPPLTTGPLEAHFVKGQVRIKGKTLVILNIPEIVDGSRMKKEG